MSWLLWLLFWIGAVLVAAKTWFKLSVGWCSSNVCLVGKTVIVTGANAGIGYDTAVDFAKRGAKVILACRDPDKGQEAKKKIVSETDNPFIFFKLLDLSSFKSVRQFAEDINETEERLDILVNNAGAIGTSKKTSDDLYLVLQANYFGHFLLTNLLLDLIKKTPKSRIVNVSSIGAKYTGDLDINDPNHYVPDGFQGESLLYGRSKLYQILFTIQLAKRLKETSVAVFSLHPGAVYTNLLRSYPTIIKLMFENIIKWFFKLGNICEVIIARSFTKIEVNTSVMPGNNSAAYIGFEELLAIDVHNLFLNRRFCLPTPRPQIGQLVIISVKFDRTCKNSIEGAQTTIYCSIEQGIEHLSGRHFHDCHVVDTYEGAQDPSLPSKLWKVSEKLVNLNQK